MINRKKLVYILHDIAVGGVEMALLSAIPELTKHYDLKILVLGSVDESLIQGLSQEEKNIFHSFKIPVYAYPFQLKKITNWIIEERPALIISSLWRASWVGTAVKKKLGQAVKFISFIHSTNFPHYFAYYFNGRAVKLSDLVLTDSQSSFLFVKKKFEPRADIKVISFLTHKTPEIYPGNKIPDNKILNLLSLGRIQKVKNIPLALEVISELRNKGYTVILDIYGRPGNDYDAVIKKRTELNLEQNVFFKGVITGDEKFALFNKYHFIIQLSSYEGMAMSIAEAMQHGLPVIASPVGEIPYYSKDMQSAIHFNINDSSKWKENILKIEHVINTPALYQQISVNSWASFQYALTYSQSLLEAINSIIPK